MEISPNLLEELLRIGRELGEKRELDLLLNQAIDLTINIFQAEYAYLILVNGLHGRHLSRGRDKEGRDIGQLEERISHTIFERVIEQRNPLLLADAMTEVSDATSVNALMLRSIMCVPLISRDAVIGALYVENRSRRAVFHRSDVPTMQFLASQIATAITNAILTENLEEQVASRTQELQQAWGELVDTNQAMMLLLSKIAHDIRSPLGILIRGFERIEQGAMGTVPSGLQDWNQNTIRTLEHTMRLTDSFFSMTTGNVATPLINPTQTALNPFLEHIYSLGEMLPWAQGVEFKLQLEGTLPTLAIDEMRIQQVLLNLLSNALRFTQNGGVVLYAQAEIDFVTIGVRDTGVGIDPDMVKHVFERFVQVGEQQMRKGGVGLGLAIACEIVELHGGSIFVNTEPDQGSDFYFRLPLNQAA